MDGCIRVSLISTVFTFWLSIPLSRGIKPNGNIPTINESSIVYGPVGCTVGFGCRLLHSEIILLNQTLQTALCNKAPLTKILTIGCSEALKFAIKTLMITSTKIVNILFSYFLLKSVLSSHVKNEKNKNIIIPKPTERQKKRICCFSCSISLLIKSITLVVTKANNPIIMPLTKQVK